MSDTLVLALYATLLRRPMPADDKAQPEAKAAQAAAVAYAVAPLARSQRVATPIDWAALVLAIREAESAGSLRIHAGRCLPLECDRGRARGPWQVHRYSEASLEWERMHGIENTSRQAWAASAILRRGFYTCRGSADWVTATINGYAGRRCGSTWPGLTYRLALWQAYRAAIGRELARAKER